MDLLSGLLLTGVVVWILYLVVRALFDEAITARLENYFRPAQNPVHDRLVGATGTVVELPAGDNELLRVRIGIESWNARLGSSSDGDLEVGSDVKVTGVDGMVLDVEACE